jgi:predicted ATPase/tetratricopeptide (TPR) repeat protein
MHNPWSPTFADMHLLHPSLTEAVELYRGEFMSGLNLSGAQAFDESRLQESENLQAIYLDALERLVRGHRTFGEFAQALQYARSWLAHDRYNETAQYTLLQLHAITGQRATAINQYKRYKDFLSHELGLDPSEELTNLYKQILTGRVTPPSNQKVKTPIFLIADIERAPLLWTREGVNKDEYLSTYQDIFKEASKRFGGHILQRSEDNITILFENGQPLDCAVTIHLKVCKADWGEAGPPNLRMVLYSTSVGDGNYKNFAMLTRAATNLLSISWGGQIIFSERTLSFLDLPPGSRIRDLGFHSLQEIEGPVHVYEVLHPHLPAGDHPPLQSGSMHSTTLPTLTPAFIGRDTELNQLAHLLDSPDFRIISLVGPGGVGKTRLAVQFATQISAYFPDGIYFISLAPIQDPDLIPIVLADALKFSFFGPQNHLDQLGDYLHRMNALLVFDNFEHLRLEGINLLAFILDKTHHLKIIVTTRERLNLASETILEVNGLPVPPSGQTENVESYSSIKLFLQNVRRVSPKFSFENNASAIIRICQLVNGLPLGIILASSWVRVYACPQIAEEIKNNIDFLATSAPDIIPRHRSLRAVFDHSWQLLSEEERQILCHLSIFCTSFTAHAAYQICAATPLILTTFLDKSLLHHREDRYEMLDTFRQYALSKLVAISEEYASTKAIYCDYYVDLCMRKHLELNTSDQRQAIDEMITEVENIRTAWIWMVESDSWDMVWKIKDSLLTFNVMTGNFIQGREFFRLALNKLIELNDPLHELILANMQQLEAWMAIKIGFISEGVQNLSACIETFRSHNSTWDLAMSFMILADAHRMLGNHHQAIKIIEDALHKFHELASLRSNYIVAVSAHCQSILGTIYLELGDFEQAQVNLQASLATHHRLGTNYGSINPLLGLARLAYLQGDFTQSRDMYEQTLDTATAIYDQHGMVFIHNNLGAVYEDMGYITESYHHVLIAFSYAK